VTRHFAKADKSVIMGVGSVVDAPTAGIYIANGANFVVGPVLKSRRRQALQSPQDSLQPGCGSASEIGFAEELGVEIVKIFPGTQVGGPEFVKAVLGPMPWTKIMPTGGVDPTEESLAKWLARGSWRRASAPSSSPPTCSRRRIMRASRRKSPRPSR